MKALSPKLVAELSSVAYQAMAPLMNGQLRLDTSISLDKHFTFNICKTAIIGTSGGFVAKAKN
ncbi:hypothetical protein [Shewanella sp. ENK2]|uniref:hypothetical protein n=1 Tax=Shewanella sp. ENK2 TaxID=2775245 RepID=UPI003748180C